MILCKISDFFVISKIVQTIFQNNNSFRDADKHKLSAVQRSGGACEARREPDVSENSEHSEWLANARLGCNDKLQVQYIAKIQHNCPENLHFAAFPAF